MLSNYKKIRSVFYVIAIILLLIRLYNGLLLHQLSGNPVFYTSKDLSFIVFSSIPFIKTVLQSSFTAWFIDITLFISALGALFVPKANKFPILFSITLFFYIVIYYSSHGVHHSLVGLFFMSIPFVFANKKKFETALAWVRLSVVWVYFSAGLWKVIRGAFLHGGYFSTLIKEHYGLQMYLSPDSLANKIRWFVADNVALSNSFFILLVIAELLFIIAFFTQRYDKYFAIFILVFQSLTWFFADTYFFDFAPALLPFFFYKNTDLTIKIFKENKVALSLYSLHLLVFIYALMLIGLGKYNSAVFSVFPFQNYYMYSDPYTKNEFSFIKIMKRDKCLNCAYQFPPQREVINANIKYYKPNDTVLKKWIEKQITQKYKSSFTEIEIVYLNLQNQVVKEQINRKMLITFP
ncbi:MAG: hypothetical protein R2836_00050 [Chitinophagales bacterium]